MGADLKSPTTAPPSPKPGATARPLSPAAQRALAEAAERRAAIDVRAAGLDKSPQRHGRGGPEPVRYWDLEVKGLASVF